MSGGATLWLVGVVGLAVFAAALRQAFQAVEAKRYRIMWGWYCWASIALAVVALVWAANGDPSLAARNIILGLIGAALGSSLAVWGGYVVHDATDHLPTASSGDKSSQGSTIAPVPVTPPDVTLRIVFAQSPAVEVINASNSLAREIRWTLLLWNMSDPKVYSNPGAPDMADKHEPLPLPSSTIDYIRANSKSGPLNFLNSLFVAPYVKGGNHLFGSASVICPDCQRGRTFVVDIVLGEGGWYYEVADEKSGNVLIPTRLTKQHVVDYYNLLIARIPEQARLPIKDPF